ncbi:MAG: M15 family metallopeptidase [Moorea sp. SIO3I6]|nr:M15 family metallopeptidase [Moorena sp. SIO3I6]
MKKPLLRLRKRLAFWFLSSLVASLIVLPGCFKSAGKPPEFSTKSTQQKQEISVDRSPSNTEESLGSVSQKAVVSPGEEPASVPALHSQKQLSFEGELALTPTAPSQKPLNSEQELTSVPALPPQKQLSFEQKLPPLPAAPPQGQPNPGGVYGQPPELLHTPPQVETHLGHFPYAENQRQNLVKVADFYGREEFLDRTAANAFFQMQADAKASGVDLTIISGFRSVPQQERLFSRQISKRGSREAAARLSAPPGHSEHHTGYAVDIGEGEDIDTFLKPEFESTKAYRWLAENAYRYGFELSFPQGNSQGVSYEPWHWRYVGSPEATAVFSPARLTY